MNVRYVDGLVNFLLYFSSLLSRESLHVFHGEFNFSWFNFVDEWNHIFLSFIKF